MSGARTNLPGKSLLFSIHKQSSCTGKLGPFQTLRETSELTEAGFAPGASPLSLLSVRGVQERNRVGKEHEQGELVVDVVAVLVCSCCCYCRHKSCLSLLGYS